MTVRDTPLRDRLEAVERQLARDVRRAQRRFRQSLPAYLQTSRPLNVLSAPFIYSMIVPLVLLDFWLTAYQWICFPLFGIARVRRRDFFVIDRHRLPYLNAIEKLNCVYCGYANGVIAYVREVAARTEQYWCPIQHRRSPVGPHERYGRFVRYGDAAGYRRELPRLRRLLNTGRGVERLRKAQ